MLRISVICLVVGIYPAVVVADHAHEDLVVGVDGTGRLKIEFSHWDESHELLPVSGLLHGWLGDHPGFAHVENDEPAEDMYTLEEGAQVWLEVVEFDGCLSAYDGGFVGGPYNDAGDQALLGDEHLHTHLEWHIDSNAAGFSVLDGPWEATFRLIDMGDTQYSDSQDYTLKFVPEPVGVSLLGFGALVVGIRRRSE